ncbi:MarR family winged helix-turn-helix transcriptional regulator [Sphingobacterium sp. HJSM2_6]|uniref:MarR family winged helix-turn-helix transcriptional regulator n=1 Tax=Sphingobacterium sp. HJSM2_6 TaxID=3366264 RepID=UPI003BD8ADE9
MEQELKLENQVCFPIYTLAKELIVLYRPILDKLDLTYPQYLTMLVLWEKNDQTVSELGSILNLDSGTLTPLLKRLEQKKLVNRIRSKSDERLVYITLTTSGLNLKQSALEVPFNIKEAIKCSDQEIIALKAMIEKILLKIKS